MGEPRSLYVSVKLPVEDDNDDNDECFAQMLNTDESSAKQHLTATEMDSLKQVYNIDFGRPNRFNRKSAGASGGKSTTTIKEENENERTTFDDDNGNTTNSENDSDDENDDDDDDDEGLGESGGRTYGPFSRIHTLISSEKNRRIVNAGNKSEMNAFVNESRANSQMTIRVHIPQIKCLLSDQRFLNDLYNCFLNDLIMWVPTKLPPIESSLLVWDALSAGYVVPNLATLIESGNLEFFEFLASINPSVNMACILGFGSGLGLDATDDNEDENLSDGEGRMFHMCKSAILKSPSSASDLANGGAGGSGDNMTGAGGSGGSIGGFGGAEYCESDDDRSKRKYMDNKGLKSRSGSQVKSGGGGETKKTTTTVTTAASNNFCLVLSIEKAHLKAFVCPNMSVVGKSGGEQQQQTTNTPPPLMSNSKYGEFDVRTTNLNLCVASSETIKNEFTRNRYLMFDTDDFIDSFSVRFEKVDF